MVQGPTWQQAVQYIQEVPLTNGERYTITVKHDTYGLSFCLQSDLGSTSLVNSSFATAASVPLYVSLLHLLFISDAKEHFDDVDIYVHSTHSECYDTTRICAVTLTTYLYDALQDLGWKKVFDDFSHMNEQLTRAVVQNPLEYRAVAMAAVDFGSRPHDLDMDVEQATAFCHRFMS